MPIRIRPFAALPLVLCLASPAFAQAIESTGSRALGMGGAFVAVANDSSAAWWNPAGLAAGPFMDLALTRAVTEFPDGLPASRTRVSSFALGTPPFGFSVYRFTVSSAGAPAGSTASDGENREETGAGVPLRALSVTQVGATLVHSIVSGVHVGTTLKYLRGSTVSAVDASGASAEALLGRAADLEDGDAEGTFDLDAGVLAVAGPVRLGLVGRNLREPEFGSGAPATLSRQVRAGVAFAAEDAGSIPLTLAIDADLRTYDTVRGARRVVAVGGEQWLLTRRLGLRAGARFNMAGAEDRALTAGASVAVRSGFYLDVHAVRGGDSDRGWGGAARVSF